jgi:hypothetical protein
VATITCIPLRATTSFTNGISRQSPGVGSPGEARRVVAYWAEEGATWLKLQGGLTRAVAGAIIDEAHKHGMRVTGHLCSLSFADAFSTCTSRSKTGKFSFTPGDCTMMCSCISVKPRSAVSTWPETVLTVGTGQSSLERRNRRRVRRYRP